MDVLGLILTMALIATIVHPTKFYSCKENIVGKLKGLNISDCEKPPCVLKKGTQPSIDIVFNTNNDVEQLQNKVFAKIIGVPLPFVGVDGTPACDHVYQADGTTLAGCPLVADTDYVYRNSFYIHNYYPSVSPRIHWALQDASNHQDVVCFEVSAEIKS